MYGSELCWVARGVAYVELKAKGGKPRLERYIITKPAKANLKAFDGGEAVAPEAVIFAAPTGIMRLDSPQRHGAYQRYKQRMKEGTIKKRSALLKGEVKLKGKSKGHTLIPLTLRDPQTGMFQFQSRKEPVVL
jgi:hypothetical protein